MHLCEAIGTFGKKRGFVCSSSKDFGCFKRSGICFFDEMDPMFVQYRCRSIVGGDNSISKGP